MSPQNLFTDTSGWSEEEAPVEGYAGSLAGASGGGRDENGATGHESVVAGESDAFQSYILEMSKHRLLSHPETVTLAKTMASAKSDMIEQLARVPSASRQAVDYCRASIRTGAPLSQFLDTTQTDADGGNADESNAPTTRGELLRRIDSLERRYKVWLEHKSDETARALAVTFRQLGPNIHLLREISKACREMAVTLAPERAVGAAQALACLEQAAGTDRTTLDAVCRAVKGAEGRYTDAWRAMVQANLRLVISVARRFAVGGVPLEDLVQEGNVGLFRAVEKYDYRLGYRFSTYASFWIRQAVTKALVNQGRTMRVPSHMNDKIVKLLNVREVLQRELGRRPTPRELARRSELPLETVELAFESAQAAVSLDQSIGKEDSGTFYDITADDAAQSAEDARFAAELAALVGTLLDQLPDREELILRLRHGVGGTEPMTLEQIAQVIGVSRERVRQLEARAVSLLRAQVASNAAYLGERDDSPEADPRQPEA